MEFLEKSDILKFAHLNVTCYLFTRLCFVAIASYIYIHRQCHINTHYVSPHSYDLKVAQTRIPVSRRRMMLSPKNWHWKHGNPRLGPSGI